MSGKRSPNIISRAVRLIFALFLIYFVIINSEFEYRFNPDKGFKTLIRQAKSVWNFVKIVRAF